LSTENKKPDFFIQEGKLLLKNAEVWNSSKNELFKGDILLENGIIQKIGKISQDEKTIDLTGKLVLPGLLDLHVHLREPGREDKETIETGTNAAAAGGFTGVCCMPNTTPPIDTQEVVRFIKEKSSGLLIDVFPIGSISQGRKGEELAEIGDMVKAGIVGVSDDGSPVPDSGLMRRALEYSKIFNIPVISHAEDLSLSGAGVMHEGFYSTKLGLKGIPSLSEELMIARDIMIAEYTQGKLHITHVSTKRGVDLIRRAKDEGIQVTCDATPHHFSLTDAEIETYDANFKMNPPLRTEEDVEAIIEGLKDGTIDVIATDHAPHTIDEKDLEFDRAAFGITGLETAVGIICGSLLTTKALSIAQLVEKTVINPRKILNLEIPGIREGQIANLSILDLKKKWTCEKDSFYSKAVNSPYIGQKLVGRGAGVINKRICCFLNY